MIRLYRAVVAIVLSFALVACTSLRVVADGQAASASALRSSEPPVSRRDIVVVTTVDGRQHELRITSIDSTALAGIEDGAGEPIVIPVEQIQRIELSGVDGTKVLRAVLIFVAVSVVLGYLFARAFAMGFTTAP